MGLGSEATGPPRLGCRYSGYCAWRGVVRDSEAPEAAAAARRAYPELGSALYFEMSEQRTHAVLYELPGQRLNWLWCGTQRPARLCGWRVPPPPWPARTVVLRQPFWVLWLLRQSLAANSATQQPLACA